MNTKDITLDNWHMHCLIYGKPKTGKTLIGASFPKPYFFDFDNGMLTLRGLNVEYDTYIETSSFITKLNSLMGDETGKYETLVIDSITTLQVYYLKELLLLNKRKDASLHERGVRIDWLTNLMLQLNKAPFHTVLIAHEEVDKSELTGQIMTIPIIAGKSLPYQLPVFMDEVYRTVMGRDEKGKSTFNLLTQGDESVIAGSRLNRLGLLPRVVDVTMKDGETPKGYGEIMNFVKGVGR